MLEETCGNAPDGALGHAREQGVAQFAEHAAGQACKPIAQQGGHRQYQQRFPQAELIDDLLEKQRQPDAGDLGRNEAAQGQQHALLELPDIGQKRLEGLDIVAVFRRWAGVAEFHAFEW